MLRVNKQFTQLFGYTSDEIANRSSIDLIVPPTLKSEAAKTREQLARGNDLNIETIRLRKDSSLINVSEVAFPVLEEPKWVVAGSSGAAARLGMKGTTLQAKMQRLAISRRS